LVQKIEDGPFLLACINYQKEIKGRSSPTSDLSSIGILNSDLSTLYGPFHRLQGDQGKSNFTLRNANQFPQLQP
jgi:hypothetical protein